MTKERVDVLVLKQGLSKSREEAKRMVMAGQILNEANGLRYDKPGEKIDDDTSLIIKGQPLKYVSRGGLKLEKAIEDFHIDCTGKILLDVGASTGGFTDAALQHGASMSYALDVGYNQLAWSLRQDKRVCVMEKVNFRYAKPEMFTLGQPNLVSIDVSFISLKLMLPPLSHIAIKDADILALIKPQFEAGREFIGKKGIVKDKQVHKDVIHNTITTAIDLGFCPIDLTYSPITGGEGNIEFLVHLKNKATNSEIEWSGSSWSEKIEKVVTEAHTVFLDH